MEDNEYFSAIAQRRNYVTAENIERARAVQQEKYEQDKEYKLLGIIMLELGMLSSSQLLDILREIESVQKLNYY